MAKKKTSASIANIKKLLDEGKLIIGTERTIKALRGKKILKVLITSNCRTDIKERINYYAKIADIEVVGLPQTNEALGAVCRKPFSISVIGVKA